MKKRIAVIGYGGQGAWHCDRIMQSSTCLLAGVFDIKEDRNLIAKKKGIYIYQSVSSILTDCTVSVVIIATPNNSHAELAIKALNAGKHVICEKPATISVSEFDQILETSRKTKCFFTAFQNRRWDVDFLSLKNASNSYILGEVIRIESRVHGSRGIPNDWRREKLQGGGMVLDWGVHLIDQILQIISSKVTRVYCTTTYITNTEVEDGFRLELTFADGKSALIEVGTYNFLSMPRFYMLCSCGTILLQDWRAPAKAVKLVRWEESDATPIQNASGITKTMAPRDEKTIEEFYLPIPTNNVDEYYQNFFDAIDGKIANPIVRCEEIRRVLQIIEMAFESAATGKVINSNM